MGVRYGDQGLRGSRLFDLHLSKGNTKTRLYSLLDYTQFTLLVFGDAKVEIKLPEFVKVIQIHSKNVGEGYWIESSPYVNHSVLVRPDSYIESVVSLDKIDSLLSLPQFGISSGKRSL